MNLYTAILSLCLVSAENALREVDAKLGKCHGVEIRELTIKKVHSHFKKGTLSPEKLTECYLQRIKEMNPFLHAVIEVNPDAVEIAKNVSETMKDRPLYGIPILVKDNIGTFDKMNTTAGAPVLLTARPKRDAEVIKRLRQAGAIILGKANQNEMTGLLGNESEQGYSTRGGQTKNPYLQSGPALGSSSGSAVAVAANLAVAALGTDTSGSLIIPSMINSLFSLKPTFGMSPNVGNIPLSVSFDAVGGMTRSTQDLVAISDVIFQSKTKHLDAKKIKVNVIRQNNNGTKNDFDWFDAEIKSLKCVGIKVVDELQAVEDPSMDEISLEISFYEYATHFKAYIANQTTYTPIPHLPHVTSLQDIVDYKSKTEDDSAYNWMKIAATLSWGPEQEKLLKEVRAKARKLIDSLLDANKVDALVMPVYFSAIGLHCATVAGYPSMTIPAGVRADGLPRGLLIFSRANSEQTLISISQALETHFPRRHVPKFLDY